MTVPTWTLWLTDQKLLTSCRPFNFLLRVSAPSSAARVASRSEGRPRAEYRRRVGTVQINIGFCSGPFEQRNISLEAGKDLRNIMSISTESCGGGDTAAYLTTLQKTLNVSDL